MATMPVIASNRSPEVTSESISVLAMTQVTIEASSPSIAPTNTGRRSRRRAPTNDAVIAARMSTASRPSRKTRMAELVTTVALLALSPSVAAESAEQLVEPPPRLAQLAPRRAIGDQLRQARLAAGTEPDRALDVERQAGIERLQPPLGAELEERVGLEPRLLGLLVLARRPRRPPCGRG